MEMKERIKWRKMTLLAGLYITQYLGLGFIVTAVPAIMRKNGAGLDEIGWIYALGLIWSIKFLWAPLIDRFGSKKHGHYRSWLIVLQSLLILSLIGAAFFDINSQLGILAVFFVLICTFSATQDIAADALAVTMLAPKERGLGNSIQVAGGLIGNMIGGGLVLIVYQWVGWTGSMLVLAFSTMIPLVNILMHEEQPAPADARAEKVGFKDMLRFFKRPGTGRWVPLLLSFSVGISIAYALLNPMLVDIGWSLEEIGVAVNIFGSVFSIIGAAVAGWLAQKIGRKQGMIWSSVLVGLSIFALFPAAQGGGNSLFIYAGIGLMLLAFGASSTILSTMIMDKSDPSAAGTDYTLQYSLSSIFGYILAGSALGLAESLNYTGILWIAIGTVVLSLALIIGYKDYEPKKFIDSYEPSFEKEPAVVSGQK